MASFRFGRSAIAFAAIASVAFACSLPGDEGDTSDGALADSDEKLDVDRLLDDEDLLGGSDVTVADVQRFLDSKRSFLATYRDGDRSAAEIIVDSSRANDVNPIYILARIQGESSLVESKSPRTSLVDKAAGCGCPDGKPCAAEFKGFANQITCSARLIRKYFTELDRDKRTVSGWAVGLERKTLDPCTVTPANRATAALYTYTPWVGARGKGCGAAKWAGSSGMAELTLKYKSAFPSHARDGGPPRPPPTSCDGGTRSNPSCPSADAGTTVCVPRPASELCAAASTARGVRCGMIPDACGGFVDCTTVPSFGCATGESCAENRCSPAACVPRTADDLCKNARATEGLECGRLPDGCGGVVDCDGVATFGCAAGATCGKKQRCEKNPVEPPANPPTSTGGPATSTSEREEQEREERVRLADGKKTDEGCSAAPGSGSGGMGTLAGLALVVGASFVRRRRPRR